MRRTTVCLLPLLVGLLMAGCPQPPESPFRTVSSSGGERCVPGAQSEHLSGSGLLTTASWLVCPDRELSGDGPRVTAHEGTTTLVAGGSTELVLSYDGFPDGLAGATMVLWVQGEPSLATVPVSASGDDAPGRLTVELYTRPTAPGGEFKLMVGFDDGTGTDDNPQPVDWYEIAFEIVSTLGGDLQFALNWDTETDVDLHVIDPSGEAIFWGNPIGASGGTLDLDSNAGCAIDGVQNENAIWAADEAPSGSYRVGVNLWSACGSTSQTSWRLTILERGEPVGTFEGFFSPEEANPEADPLNVVTTFEFGG